MKVYFFSGLGADSTVFQFLDLTYCNPEFISWIKPLPKETLPCYALRLKDHYQIPDNAIICGLSFGGMLATEVAKKFPAIKVIIISSAKTKYELPALYRFGRYFTLHQYTSGQLQRWFMLNIKSLFGLKTPRYIKVYEELIANADIEFNKWAVTALVNWNNTHFTNNITHIHGTSDRILPYKFVKCDHMVKQGGHLMIMEQSGLISDMLKHFILSGSIPSSLTNQFAHQYQA